jgi:hypothetical protein
VAEELRFPDKQNRDQDQAAELNLMLLNPCRNGFEIKVSGVLTRVLMPSRHRAWAYQPLQ